MRSEGVYIQLEARDLINKMRKEAWHRDNHESISEAHTDTARIGAPYHPASGANDSHGMTKEDMRIRYKNKQAQFQSGRQADEVAAVPTGT